MMAFHGSGHASIYCPSTPTSIFSLAGIKEWRPVSGFRSGDDGRMLIVVIETLSSYLLQCTSMCAVLMCTVWKYHDLIYPFIGTTFRNRTQSRNLSTPLPGSREHVVLRQKGFLMENSELLAAYPMMHPISSGVIHRLTAHSVGSTSMIMTKSKHFWS